MATFKLQRMVDREANRAEGKGAGYDRWAALHNLKQMAATLNIYQEYGFDTPEELDEALTAAHAALQDSSDDLKTLEATLKEKSETKECDSFLHNYKIESCSQDSPLK